MLNNKLNTLLVVLLFTCITADDYENDDKCKLMSDNSFYQVFLIAHIDAPYFIILYESTYFIS